MSELNIPESWADTTLGNISNAITYGGTASASNVGNFKFLRITDLTDSGVDWETVPFCKLANGERYLVNDGDIVIARTGGTVGKSYRIEAPPNNAIYASYLIKISPSNLLKQSKYLSLFLKSPFYWGQIQEKAQGAAQPNVNATKLAEIPIGLPPVKEQERIVQKLESCFEKIDATEANLTKVESLLTKYRESLLAKAFRGELVPQVSSTEKNSTLESLIKEKNLATSKQKNVQSFDRLTEKDNPFVNVPKNWLVTDLDNVCDTITCGVAKTPNYVKNGIPFISAQNVKKNVVKFHKYEQISLEDHKNLTKNALPQKGDILYTRVGSRYGEAAIIDTDIEFSIFVSLTLLKPNKKLLCNRYLNYYLNFSEVKKIADKCVLGVAVGNLNVNAVRRFPFPLPPLDEQILISDLLDIKLKNIDVILEKVQKKRKQLLMLKDSILKKAFEGQLAEQISSEGTGHELLAIILSEKETTPKTALKEKINKTIKKAPAKKAVTVKGKKNGKK